MYGVSCSWRFLTILSAPSACAASAASADACSGLVLTCCAAVMGLPPAQDELRKLVRMLKLGLNHDGTQLLLTCIAAYLAGRQAAKLSLRRKAIVSLALQAAAASDVKIGEAPADLCVVDTTPSQSQVVDDTSPSEATFGGSMGRSASAQTLSGGEHTSSAGLRRVASEQLLANVLKARSSSGALCVDCMSRARTYIGIELEVAGGDCAEKTNDTNAKCSPSSTRRGVSFASPPACVVEESADGVGECAACVACIDATNTWARLVRRVVAICGGTAVSYLLWLRFVASPETARRHLMRWVRTLASLFRYRVENREALPTEGGALLTVYHGFIPLDMYFLHEWLYRHTGRLPLTLAADFVFRIPWFGWAARLCGAAPAGREAALGALRAGRLVIVAPGGVREGMGSTATDYTINCECCPASAALHSCMRCPSLAFTPCRADLT